MATSRAWSETAGFGPRRFAGALLSAGLLPGLHGVERGTGKTPGRTNPLEAVGQARAGRGGGTHRRDLRRPKGPDVSLLASSNFHLHGQLPDPLHRGVQFRLHRIALAFLERGSLSRRSPSHATARAGKSPRPTAATESSTGSPRKSRRATSRLRGTVHRWPSPSGPAGESLAWGKRGRAELALVYHRPINSNFLLKIVGHVLVLLGHFDYANSVSKEIGSDSVGSGEALSSAGGKVSP